MDIAKYDLIPIEFATAKEIGLAAATLGAMARRGMVEVKDSVPKQYRRIENVTVKILALCEKYKDSYDSYFVLFKKDKELGMMCSLSSTKDILDCYGKHYDVTGSIEIQFGKQRIKI